MDPVQFIILLLIAAVCGAVGQAIAGYTMGGLLVSIGIGFIGALLGGYIARQAKLPEPLTVKVGSNDFPVVWSIVGSVLFVVILSLLNRPPVVA